MRIITTNHASERMTKRGIGMPSVMAVALHGEVVCREQSASDPFPRLTYALNDLHVVLTQDGRSLQPVLVTAYWQYDPAEVARQYARRIERRAARRARRESKRNHYN